MLFRSKQTYILCGLIFILIMMCISWMSIVSSRTNKIEVRVKNMLEAGLQIAARDAPRVKVDNDGGFYGPDLNSSSSFSAVYPSIYTAVLENLQDEHVPYCKVLSIRMDTDYISELRAYAIVQFEEFPGVSKTISISSTIKAPRYKQMTGLDEIIFAR
jgi:hypothetical protein